MKKIVPFTKDIKFNTKIYEITSISLEHNLSLEENNIVSGEFIISGEYKINDSSINSEPFIYGLPFDISLDTKYDTNRLKIDIDDFKFEIVYEELLRVNIDVLIEGIDLIEMEEEKDITEEIKPDLIIESRNDKNDEEELNIEEKEESTNDESDDRFTIFENIINKKEENQMKESTDLFLQTDEKIEKVSSDNTSVQTMNSIFNNFDNNDEKYVSYYVHIVRESDNIDTICLKYGVSIDMIKEYNNIDQITLGNKIIIPYIENETI